MSNESEYLAVTEKQECSIKAHIDCSSAFSQLKGGYVRLVRSEKRRSYMIQLWNKVYPDKVQLELDLPKKHANSLQAKSNQVVIKYPDGLLQLNFEKNVSDCQKFVDKLKQCIDDQNLENDSLLIEKPSAPRKRIHQPQFSPPPAPSKLNEIPEKHKHPIVIIKNDINKTDINLDAKMKPKAFYQSDPTSRIVNKVTNGESSGELIRDVSNLRSTTQPVKRRREETKHVNFDNLYQSHLVSYGVDQSKLASLNSKNTRGNSPMPSNPAYIPPRPRVKNQPDVYEIDSKENMSSPVKNWNRNDELAKLTGSKGFSNLGNTCYMNAILQCIVNIDLFSNELISNFDIVKELEKIEASEKKDQEVENNEANEGDLTRKPKVAERSLYMCMCELLKTRGETLMADKVKQSLRQIKHAISKEDKNFSGWEQHDAQEFLCVLLEMIRANVVAFNKVYQEKKEQIMKSLVEVKKETPLIEELTNPVLDNFQFKVEHSIECQTCKKVTTNEEEYLSLGLKLPQHAKLELGFSSIQDALDEFFQEETVTDFKCQSCDEIKEVIIRRRFVKLPRILVLYLKRYEYSVNEETNVYKFCKLDNQVKLPSLITIEHLLVPDLTKVESPKPVNKSIMDLQTRVKLETKTSMETSIATVPDAPQTPKAVVKQPLGNISNRTGIKNSPVVNKIATPKSAVRRELKVSSIIDDNDDEILPDIVPDIKDPFTDEEEQLKRAIEQSLKDQEKQQKERLSGIEMDDMSNGFASISSLSLENNSTATVGGKFMNLDGACDSPELTEDESNDENSMPIRSEKTKVEEKIFGRRDPLTYADGSRMKQIGHNSNKKQQENKTRLLYTHPKIGIQKCLDWQEDTDSIYTFGSGGSDSSDNYEPSNKSKRRKRVSQESNKSDKKKSTPPSHSKSKSNALDNYGFINTRSREKKEDPEEEQIRKLLEESEKTFKEEEAMRKEYNEKLSQAIKESSLEVSMKQQNVEQIDELIDHPVHKERVVCENDPFAYRIIGIVNHLGASSTSGHYISDVFNTKTHTWSSYDDTQVSTITESDVLEKRQRTGYIFFYINNSILKDK